MDYGCRSGNAIEIIPDSSSTPVYPKQASPPLNDQSIWATDDEYRDWNADRSLEVTSNPPYDRTQFPLHPQSRAGSEQSPNKKPRGSSLEDATCSSSSSRSVAIGKLFFKTKLCGKFRSGTCPYVTNCNFAHGMEELRRPPPNWQEIVSAHDEGGVSELREEHQIPILSSSAGMIDGQRSYKGRHCKKFYTDEGCPYGDMCSFLHDEQSKDRESVAISLSPTVGPGGYGARGYGAAGSGFVQKHFSWKTRICNKWEVTGYCPFGSKCHFAHGAAELHRHGGGVVEIEGNDTSSTAPDAKLTFSSTKAATDVVASSTSVPYADVYHMGVAAQRSTAINPRPVQRSTQKWKGPDKISRIYGDWIDDID